MIANTSRIVLNRAAHMFARRNLHSLLIQRIAATPTLCANINNNRDRQFFVSRRTFADLSANAILEKARTLITDQLKKELNAVFVFQISGKNYLLDAHESRPLKVELVEQIPEKVDVTLITDEETFIKMAQGKTKSTSAFMTGKLKIKGNISIAMKAEKIFKAVKM